MGTNPGASGCVRSGFELLHQCSTVACKVPRYPVHVQTFRKHWRRPQQDLQENQDRHCDALIFFFLLLEEEREVRGHVGHPRSCIRMAAGASLTWLPASPCSPPDLPPPIGSCNENHAVRFQVLWKTVNAGIVFTLSAATTCPRRGLNVSCLILLPRSDG